MVWDARCQAQSCQRSGTAFQGPVLTVLVKAIPVNPSSPDHRHLPSRESRNACQLASPLCAINSRAARRALPPLQSLAGPMLLQAICVFQQAELKSAH